MLYQVSGIRLWRKHLLSGIIGQWISDNYRFVVGMA